MLAALTGLVHHRQRANGDEHNRDKDKDQGALHSDLAPPAHSLLEFSCFRDEPTVNVLPCCVAAKVNASFCFFL
jgi:hypothetical protein